jgi:cyclic pyranopterin phosphate synthase
MSQTTLELVQQDRLAKGSVIETARLAGIMAAKRTGDLIPLCHPLPLTHVAVGIEAEPALPGLVVHAEASCLGQTGVEMEALTAVSLACLTIYDMCKAVDRDMVIGKVQLMEKSGGRSGHYLRPETERSLGRVVAVSISERKGEKKKNVDQVYFDKDRGLRGDAHAGPGLRQVSLLAQESIDSMRARGVEVGPGDFAENITTQGLDLPRLPLGTRIHLGDQVVLELTQVGKECHDRCAIFAQVGDCVMPREGIFGRVVEGGLLRPGDAVEVKRCE